MNYSSRRKGSSNGSLDSGKQKLLTFEKALLMFLESQDADNHSKQTHKDYQHVVGAFLRYMSENHSYTIIQEITEGDIIAWLSFLRNTTSKWGKPYSSRSIETYARDVVAFFNWLLHHEHIRVNPMAKVGTPKVDKALIRVFTEQEVEMLDAACDRALSGRAITPDERKALGARDRAFLWLLLSTGVRVSEACGLLFTDIAWDEGLIYIRGKGAKERRIPFGKIAKQHLNTYVTYWRGEANEPDEHVFLNAFGAPLKKNPAEYIFARLKKVAGIQDKRVSPHTCRHWFAVNCIKNGMPTIVLKEILGHESWDMIEVYVHLAEQDNKDLYTRFSPADKLDMHHRSKSKREEIRNWRNARKKKTS